MTSRQKLDAVDWALAEVSRRLESGQLDGSGRYFTDEELAAGVVVDGKRPETKSEKASAA